MGPHFGWPPLHITKNPFFSFPGQLVWLNEHEVLKGQKWRRDHNASSPSRTHLRAEGRHCSAVHSVVFGLGCCALSSLFLFSAKRCSKTALPKHVHKHSGSFHKPPPETIQNTSQDIKYLNDTISRLSFMNLHRMLYLRENSHTFQTHM